MSSARNFKNNLQSVGSPQEIYLLRLLSICRMIIITCVLQIMVNPILHGGGGGRKVIALVSIVENFGEIQAIAMKLGDFS